MSTTAETQHVTIDNIGPLNHLDIPIVPGQITILTGPNGAGKTQALGAVEKLATNRGRLSTSDGQTAGTAVGLGAKITVARAGANRRTDDPESLEVIALEDRLNIADLVDPGVKDPHAADERRIKALVALSGTEPDLSLFYDLVGGEEPFLELVAIDKVDMTDLVAMAAGIKREIETAARTHEDQTRTFNEQARAKRAANEGMDLEGDHDSKALQQAFETAIADYSKMKSQMEHGIKLQNEVQQAREALKTVSEDYTGLSIEDADIALNGTTLNVTIIELDIDQTVRKLMNLRANLKTREAEHTTAKVSFEAAQQHFDLIAKWEETVQRGEQIEIPSDVEVQDAAHARDTSKQRMDQGVLIREGRRRESDAKMFSDQAKQSKSKGDVLRAAALGTNGVLSTVVSRMGGPFKVDGQFRLVVGHPKRGETFFSELSQGERWKLGLDVSIEAFRVDDRPGLLTIPQEAWECLDGTNRQLIIDHISGTDLAVVTAQASRTEDAGGEVTVATME